MLIAGLTGGIGSGKSTVSTLLVDLGAFLVDSDRLAREVVEIGTPGLAQLVEAFGDRIRTADGSLDRPALGAIVFADAEQRTVLNGITHPLIGARTAELYAEAEAAGTRVLVHDIPLLVETGAQKRFEEIIVVSVTPETQLDRLVRLRGMSEADARARIASQATLEERLAVATRVIHNDGPLAELEPQVRAVWADLLSAA